jgi:hypothetical protein
LRYDKLSRMEPDWSICSVHRDLLYPKGS